MASRSPDKLPDKHLDSPTSSKGRRKDSPTSKGKRQDSPTSKGKRRGSTDNPDNLNPHRTDNPDHRDKRPKATADNPDHKDRHPRATADNPDRKGNTSSHRSKDTDSRKASISSRAATHRAATLHPSRGRRAKRSTWGFTFVASALASSSWLGE